MGGRTVGFEGAQSIGESRVERNTERGRPLKEALRGNGGQNVNLPPFLAAHLGRGENGKPLQSSLTSAYGGQALLNNIGGNLPSNGTVLNPVGSVTPFVRWIEDYPLPDGLKMPSHIGSYDGKGDPDNFLHLFKGAIRMQKWLMPILGLYEEQRISGFVHGLRIRSLVEHLSTDLPSTYKGLMEKTYTWVGAREVATNGDSSDRRDSFERQSKVPGIITEDRKTKTDSPPTGDLIMVCFLVCQKVRRKFSLRRRLQEALSHLQRCLEVSDREICLSTVTSMKITDTIPMIVDTSELRFKRLKKDKDTAPAEAPILMVSQEANIAKSLAQENIDYKGKEIIFPPLAKVNNAPVIIEAKIFGRKVGRVYMDSESSCEIIYEHCFEKLNPTIKATKVDLKNPLVGFSGERSCSIGEVLLEITIGDAPLSRTKTLNFVIVRSDYSHNMLLGRTAMQRMGIVVSTIHGAIKFHTKNRIGIVLLADKTDEGTKKAKKILVINKERVLNCVNAKEKIIVNDKYPDQTVTIRKQLPEHFKKEL
ncbi:reverse transcriptase domain-containing protein [Tanacetum coccineum]